MSLSFDERLATAASPVPQPGEDAAPKRVAEDDFELARILQQQEMAYFNLSQGAQAEGAPEQSSDASSGAEGDEEAPDDEALALRLQMEEEQAYMQASQGAYGGSLDDNVESMTDADVDALQYEDLQALGDIVGEVSKGLDAKTCAALPAFTYDSVPGQDDLSHKCCVCQFEYEPDEQVILLPCKHLYHRECILEWLENNKRCPSCGKEIECSEGCHD